MARIEHEKEKYGFGGTLATLHGGVASAMAVAKAEKEVALLRCSDLEVKAAVLRKQVAGLELRVEALLKTLSRCARWRSSVSGSRAKLWY